MSVNTISPLGIGHFTTFRVSRVGVNSFSILYFDSHYERLLNSNEVLELLSCQVPTRAEILDYICEFIQSDKEKGLSDYRVRVACYPDSFDIKVIRIPLIFSPDTGELVSKTVPTWKVCAIESERIFPSIKSTSALPSQLARMKAKGLGFNEALLVDREGLVNEGAWSNLLIQDEDDNLIIFNSNKLSGITESIIASHYPSWTKNKVLIKPPMTVEQLKETAKTILLTSSIQGLVQATQFEEIKYKPSDLTTTCHQNYHKLFINPTKSKILKR